MINFTYLRMGPLARSWENTLKCDSRPVGTARIRAKGYESIRQAEGKQSFQACEACYSSVL